MARGRLILLCIAAAMWLAGCAHPVASTRRDPLILVSIDGFRADYLDRGVTPTLARLAAEGARGEGMRPSFPSNTFPNHYSLVTGLRPDRHGVVNNNMEDADQPGVTFSMSNRAAVGDGRWWDDATPLWITAERAGIRTAPVFWPGSEAEIGGVRPSHWAVFAQAMSSTERVDRLLALLDLPPPQRPGFLTLYFDVVDTAGHNTDPTGPGVHPALAEVDAAIARLTAGLTSRGIAANLVIVADHGMAPVPPGQVIYLDEVFAPLPVRLVYGGAIASLEPLPGRAAEAERTFLAPDPRFTCWRKGEVPARFRYGRHRRAPAIVCLATTGWYLTTRARDRAAWSSTRGQHGFDPYDPAMAALFIAHGPAFRRGVTVPPFDNVDVYPLLTRLLGVPPEPGDGQAATLAPIAR
jgi:predicted AlkP superfamily pyrophosphatase or phosphodiesterase